ncbi:right-handed parallel beta-helix repeat-containing protein [Sphingorhabdus lacus]|uniref:right-handed parallel beta-helix repeat-containing protein n=1 Tax=Sphingorhabdus lacus TaxID=392610 RepID=UPI0035938067
MRKTQLLLISLLSAVPATAQSSAPFQNAETGRSYTTLQKAVDSIGEDKGTIIIAPGSYRQCAIQTAGVIAFRAAVPGQVVFDGATCEGKAALVLRGQAASVDGIIFQNMRVPDANGAGIRLEKGDLTVTRAIFRNSEQGILTAEDRSASIRIDQSTFSGLGRCDRGLSCAHSIYIGGYGSLTVTNSRFERGNGGHYVKSRAAQVTISDNAFDDTRGKETNYMIDLPNGATGSIVRNIFVQGASKENYSAFITVAPEGRQQTSAGLAINANEASIAPGVDRQTTFLADWSGDRIALGGNRLGRGLKPFERR